MPLGAVRFGASAVPGGNGFAGPGEISRSGHYNKLLPGEWLLKRRMGRELFGINLISFYG